MKYARRVENAIFLANTRCKNEKSQSAIYLINFIISRVQAQRDSACAEWAWAHDHENGTNCFWSGLLHIYHIISYRAVVCATLHRAQCTHSVTVSVLILLETVPCAVCAHSSLGRSAATPNYRVAMRSYLFSYSNRVISHYGVQLFFYCTNGKQRAQAQARKKKTPSRKHTQTVDRLPVSTVDCHLVVLSLLSAKSAQHSMSAAPRTDQYEYWIFYQDRLELVEFLRGKYAPLTSATTENSVNFVLFFEKCKQKCVYE